MGQNGPLLLGQNGPSNSGLVNLAQAIGGDLEIIARKMKLLAMTFNDHPKRHIKNVEKNIWWNMVKYAN